MKKRSFSSFVKEAYKDYDFIWCPKCRDTTYMNVKESKKCDTCEQILPCKLTKEEQEIEDYFYEHLFDLKENETLELIQKWKELFTNYRRNKK